MIMVMEVEISFTQSSTAFSFALFCRTKVGGRAGRVKKERLILYLFGEPSAKSPQLHFTLTGRKTKNQGARF